MIRIAVGICIPEHFHAEDDLHNLLNDDAMQEELESALSRAAADWVVEVVEGIAWRDIHVDAKRIFGIIMVE